MALNIETKRINAMQALTGIVNDDSIIVELAGADGTGKSPMVVGVIGGGDREQAEMQNKGDHNEKIYNTYGTAQSKGHRSDRWL